MSGKDSARPAREAAHKKRAKSRYIEDVKSEQKGEMRLKQGERRLNGGRKEGVIRCDEGP